MAHQENLTLWFTEEASPYDTRSVSVKSCLFTGRTAFQEVTILDTHDYGKMLIIDGQTQSAEEDEYIYHEALVHPAMMTHPDPRRVLIIGAGEGATLREVLRYGSVEQAVLVDIDRELVELCKKFLPEWHQGSFDNPRVELIFDDGKAYMEHTETLFDVIVLDGCDAMDDSPALSLYSEEFYRQTRARLAPGGVLAVQGMEVCSLDYHDYKGHLAVREMLQRLFPVVRSYTTFVPSFWTEWGFVIASDSLDPTTISHDILASRLRQRGPAPARDLGAALGFYDSDAHVRMFTLSKDCKAALAGLLPIEETPT
jgi:spermidine synthase